MTSSPFLFLETLWPEPTLVSATLASSRTTQKTGGFSACGRSGLETDSVWCRASFRVPANCAYTSMSHPSVLSHPPIEIKPDAPRGHGLINGGLIVLTPSKDLFEQIVVFLRTSPLIATFSFADQDLYAA